jgi:hypothetical protein
MSRREATLAACRLRLRPILMTSFAFILGVLPLVWSTGAGFEMRRALGVAVFSGMLGVTFFGILLTPVFFSVIDWIGSTPAFHSHLAHKINRISLDIFAGGFIRIIGRMTRRLRTEGERASRHRLTDRGQGSGVGSPETHPAGNGQHSHTPNAVADRDGVSEFPTVEPPVLVHQNGNSADDSESNGKATKGDATNGTATNAKSTNGDPYSTDCHHDPSPDPTVPD